MKEVKSVSKKEVQKLINHYFKQELNLHSCEQFLVQQNLTMSKNSDQTTELNNVVEILSELIYNKLLLDIEYIAQKDPSLTSINDVIKSKTKSLVATMMYRIANFFYYNPLTKDQQKIRLISREMMEDTITLTGIDIHPAAKIGEKFFIDHGNGVVIGETCEIGERCNIFNGVILGSKNVVKPKLGKRHPTIKNNVTICAGAKILGDITIGNNVFISPGAVVLDEIEDNQKVLIVNQLQITKIDTYSYLPSQKVVVYGIIPKFKNSINILGEGFYNPNVIIKLKGNKELSYTITYWDKNKIMVKFKNTTPFEKEEVKNIKLIVFSNNNKVIILNNLGLERALTALTE